MRALLVAMPFGRIDRPSIALGLLKAALDQALDGRPLRTREVMIAMRARGGPAPGG